MKRWDTQAVPTDRRTGGMRPGAYFIFRVGLEQELADSLSGGMRQREYLIARVDGEKGGDTMELIMPPEWEACVAGGELATCGAS